MTEQEVNNLIDSKIAKTKMSQLPEATQTSGLYSIGYTGNQSVKYKANLLQGDPLTVRKTYQTEAEALADKNPIDTTTSLPLTVGQFVSIVDDGEKNGIYRIGSISGDGTMSLELQGKLGDLSGYTKTGGSTKTTKEIDDIKADHGYASIESAKTLKQVEEDVSTRILPPYQEFLGIDRPDLDAALIEVDNDNKIIRIITETDEPDIFTEVDFDRPDLSVVFTDSDGKIIHKEYSGEVGDDLNKIMAVAATVDRPDLDGQLVVLDKYDRVIFQSGEYSSTASSPEPELGRAMEYTKRFWNPPAQEGFNVQSVIPDPENILVNYNNLIEKWDEILDRQVINPELEPYISKEEIGRSGAGNLPIYRYDFKPQNPKYKVVLNAGTHANEKIYIQVLLNFFDHFTTEWVNDPVLEWLYRTVHFIVVPVRGPYTLGFPRKIRGSRQMPETDPIPMSWTRSGTTVTMTFDVADFPVNENLNAETYFTEVPDSALVGKGSFGVITSSDEEALPLNAYKIGGVVDGRTISFTVPDDTGATSGTGTFQVWADPNRNFNPIDTNNWFNFNSTTNPSMFDVDQLYNPNGQVYGFYDGKGTKPQSLRENADFMRMIDSEAPDLVYDLHGPAGDHYFSYKAMPSTNEFERAIENMKEFSGRYSTTGFSRVTGLGTIIVSQSSYIASKGIPTAAIEWGGGVQSSNAKGVQDAMRWLIVAVTEVLKTIK